MPRAEETGDWRVAASGYGNSLRGDENVPKLVWLHNLNILKPTEVDTLVGVHSCMICKLYPNKAAF